MGYFYAGRGGHREGLIKVLTALRWDFAKDREYPEFLSDYGGGFHPNLVIEDAIDEIRLLEHQLAEANARQTDAERT